MYLQMYCPTSCLNPLAILSYLVIFTFAAFSVATSISKALDLGTSDLAAFHSA